MRLSRSCCFRIAELLTKNGTLEELKERVRDLHECIEIDQSDIEGGIVFTLEEAKALLMKNGSSGARVTTCPKRPPQPKSPPPNPSTGFKGW